MARQLDKTIEKRDQQSNDKQATADSERAAGSTARGKQSKRQRDVATRKVIKKRYLDETARKDSEERQREKAARYLQDSTPLKADVLVASLHQSQHGWHELLALNHTTLIESAALLPN